MQYTYNQLLASCQNYCVDNSVELVNEFDNIVQLAEMRIIKDLNLSEFDTEATGSLVTSSPLLLKPDDYIVINDFFIIVNSQRVYLQQRSKSWLNDYWRTPGNMDTPAYYADNNADSWIIAPTPDDTYAYQINYVVRPTPMSSSNQTSWIGTKLGECLFYATLPNCMAFLKDDVVSEAGLIQYWEQKYQMAIAQALKELAPLVSADDNSMTKLTTMTR